MGRLAFTTRATLALRGSVVSVVPQQEDVAVLPDGSMAFVLSRSERPDFRGGPTARRLVTHLELAGKPNRYAAEA